MFRIAITTLGCKTNHYDSARLLGQLDPAVFVQVPFKQQADAYIINSCTVTATADRQSRQFAYRARRTSPEALVILTGCYANTAKNELLKIQEIDQIVTREQTNGVIQLLLERARSHGYKPSINDHGPRFSTRDRPYLKVQDGCEAHCSYCIIPRARGPVNSKPINQAVEELSALGEQGYKEVVLTGIHIGQWGRDLPGKPVFSDLLQALDESKHIPRIRLSSLEPLELTDRVIDIIKYAHSICPHLHIPLQSGCDSILERMRRPYRTRHYAQRIERAVSEILDVGIGLDVIVGFPGESEDEFKQTEDFIRTLPIDYLHVFPYSERPDTPAASMPDQVPVQQRRERARRLIELDQQSRLQSAKRQFGKTLTVLVEQDKHRESRLYQGFSTNYYHVLIDSEEDIRNNIVDVIAGDLYNHSHHLIAKLR